MDSRGGTSKGGGKRTSGGGTIKITKSKEMQTKQIEERIIHLRRAIFDDDGRDKNVTIGIAAPFLKYDRNGLDVEIKFSHCLTNDELDWTFAVVKCNMEDIYDASGYQWDDDDKEKELTEGGARFLLVREKTKPGEVDQGRLVAFAHFRFSVQGEVMDKMEGETMLYVWDIHVDDEYQRKGLGRHMLTLMELIARREGMKMIALPVQLNDERTLTWINAKCKGYEPDKSLLAMIGFDSEMEGFEVFAKNLDAPKPKPVSNSITEQVVKAPVPPKTTTTASETPKKVVVIESPSPCGVDEGACSPMPCRSGSIEGSPVPSLEVWQTMTARSPSTSPRKSSSSSIDRTTTPSSPPTTRGSSPLMQKQIKSSPAVSVGNEIDGDWEMVSKRELTNELSSSGDSNGLNDSGVLVEKSEPEDEDGDEEEVDPSVPTFVEADILAQIKRMFKQRNGREPTLEEEAIWLTQIREAETEKVEGGDEEVKFEGHRAPTAPGEG